MYFMVGIAIFILLLFVAHKVRRIHQISYQILEHAQIARAESEAIYSQIQALLALDKILSPKEPLPPMRGWAGSPDFLLAVAKHILKEPVTTVLECSSGVSTVVSARCLQMRGVGHVYSLEHDAIYAQRTRDLLEDHGLTSWATVIDAPLVTNETDTQPWYDLTALPVQMPSADVLIVDGPPATTASLARYPALPKLKERISPVATIFLDDADRPDEKIIVQRWLVENPEFRSTHLYCEKGLEVLSR
jgi:hypothetical protein